MTFIPGPEHTLLVLTAALWSGKNIDVCRQRSLVSDSSAAVSYLIIWASSLAFPKHSVFICKHE